eukprot:NODE_2105_length_987_cov_89.828358_g1722_i0.p1 GENE.NODE_2105_length_987_cov_89.828358_g1722_i0~~NODE_2105_length_987_cov_89.828358_g1722_i0.p1  ORF type:complete len:290 (+),score=55.15 NODE_2105_length_987_cov_89.828358_g1722_i0:56-871(+)
MSTLITNDHTFMNTSCGSPHYAAPEIIKGEKYDGKLSDVWSLGIMLFAFNAGHLPFDDRVIPRLLEKVCRNQYQMPPTFDGALRDLVNRMLTTKPTSRITLHEVICHPYWITKCREYNFDLKGMSNSGTVDDLNEPVPEPFDREVMNLIVMANEWMENRTQLDQSLQSTMPNPEKAFYKLLEHQKAANSNSLAHLDITLIRNMLSTVAPTNHVALGHTRNMTDVALIKKEKKKGLLGKIGKMLSKKTTESNPNETMYLSVACRQHSAPNLG